MSGQAALFDLPATPRRGARRTPEPVPATGQAGVPTVAGTARTWMLVIAAPTISVRDKKTRTTKVMPAWLTMNGRHYWRKKAAMVADWREATQWHARAARLPVGQVQGARFDVVLRFTTGVRRDPVNWHPTVKAIIDALTAGTAKHPGYGFLPDDAPRFLHCEECPHIRIGERLPSRAGGPLGQVELTITDLSAVDGAPC